MARLFVILVLLAVGVGALGYHQGWFKLSTANTPKGANVKITVDKEKLEEDKERAKEKLQGLADQVKGKGAGRVDAARKDAPARERGAKQE